MNLKILCLNRINRNLNTISGKIIHELTSTKIVINKVKNSRENEGIFLICDKCLWNATCLNASYRQKIMENSKFCPVCNQDQLSSFPLKVGDFINTTISRNVI